MTVTPLANNKIEVITKSIPVYHVSQTRPGNFRERTRAIIRYGNVFWRHSQASNYIKKNLEPDKYDAFAKLMLNLPFGQIGKVVEAKKLRIKTGGRRAAINLDLDSLKEAWRKPLMLS